MLSAPALHPALETQLQAKAARTSRERLALESHPGRENGV